MTSFYNECYVCETLDEAMSSCPSHVHEIVELDLSVDRAEEMIWNNEAGNLRAYAVRTIRK